MPETTYSFVLPAYNESERLTTSLPKVLDYVHQRRSRAEIIVVNDGSRDNTAEIVHEFALSNPEIRLLENPGNRGKGYSVRNGMLHARGDILLFSDTDLSSPIYEADKLIAAIRALPRAQKVTISDALAEAFAKLTSANGRLAELEKLLKSESP